jgi:glycosyltransferase involved in cell wall biosynthesis
MTKSSAQSSFAQSIQSRLQPHRGFLLILLLFVSFRLMMVLAYPPEALTSYSDYPYFYALADLARQGYYPLLHYWHEYPPLFPYLSQAVYAVTSGYHAYATLLAVVMLVFEAGNLVLLYLMANEIHDKETSLKIAWMYSCLLMPIFVLWSSIDCLSLFFMMLSILCLLRNRHALSAVALGLGLMTKYLPGILLATVWRFKTRKALGYTLIVAAVAAAILLPFAIASPSYTLASLRSQASKSSWQTAWALIDGNYTTGLFGPVADHLDPAKASLPLHNPSQIPWFVTVPIFGLIYLYLFSRAVDTDDKKALLSFTGMTLCLFFLWSKGWSPQWQVMLIPLILLVFPNGRGALYCIVLGFVNFLEWPVILSRGLTQFLPLTVVTRTLILGLMAVELYRALPHRPQERETATWGSSQGGTAPPQAQASSDTKVIVVMPAYNAAKTLEQTYRDIPPDTVDHVILVDDVSQDQTVEIAQQLGLEAIVHLQNKGYGGNQKTCYLEALRAGADIVVMLHPDYQYDSRLTPELIAPIQRGEVDMMMGSRFLGEGALKGGMPIWKYISNRFLTIIENLVLGQHLSECHTGLRAYSRRMLETIPFLLNSDKFVFDTEIIAQAVAFGFRISEISVPTRYFEEASSVNFENSVIYGLSTLWVMVRYLAHRLELVQVDQFSKRLTDVLSPYHQPAILGCLEDNQGGERTG